MTVALDEIRACFEGAIPATLATADADGTPNICHLAHVQYVDSGHVALACQFLNKTRRNLQANPQAQLTVTDPHSGAQYRLALDFLRAEPAGALFDGMQARLAALASHTGLSGMFPLQETEVFHVRRVDRVPGGALPAPAAQRNALSALRRATDAIRLDAGLDAMLADAMDALGSEFGIDHAMLLLADGAGSLAPAASRGYDSTGAAIAPGAGIIGVAAQARSAIRVGHMNGEYAYQRAIRATTVECGFGIALEAETGFPGLAEPRSQMALPMLAGERLAGVLYVESTVDFRFTHEDEDALALLAAQLGQEIAIMQGGERAPEAAASEQPAAGDVLVIRHFAANDSIFLGEEYLIKGVAGSIFAALVADCIDSGRTEFSNRELRLDGRIRLPDLSDNLEARLVLLARRLDERGAPVRIEKTGRGRFRLRVDRPIRLVPG